MSESPSVAVVGAAGFVGRELLRALRKAGIRVTAVVRGAPELALDGEFHDARDPAAAVAAGGFETVINLAYPNSGPGYSHPAQNQAIVRTVNGLVVDGGRLIHVSTQAVFGLALDRPVELGPVSMVRDVPYVESKIAAENAFTRKQSARRLCLDVVRLGNVMGAASGAWAAPLVHRLLTGRPVGVAGRTSPSNTTDVVNVASYLVHLLQTVDSVPRVRYHHLAEFSHVDWGDWIGSIAAALEVEPVDADPELLEMPSSAREEMAAALRPVQPRQLYRQLAAERRAGSWARTMLRTLPGPLFDRAKGGDQVFASAPVADRAEQEFLAVLAGRQEFKSVVSDDWRPTLTQEESRDRLLQWLARD